MNSVYIMLLLNSEDPLRKENAFKDGKKEIIKIGYSSDVKQRKIQINALHNNLLVEESFEYPFYNYDSVEKQMHSEFSQYGEHMMDKNGCNLLEYYKVDKECYNEIHESLRSKCLKYLPDLTAEFDRNFDRIDKERYEAEREKLLLKRELEDIKEKSLLLEKQYNIIQYKNVINKLLRYIFNDDTTNKEKTIVDALKLLENV